MSEPISDEPHFQGEARAVAQAVGSVEAERLTVDTDVEAITDRWVRGEISSLEMRDLVRKLYGL